jgi:acetyl-CoA carboxylase carboxyl transferase subunit alpha
VNLKRKKYSNLSAWETVQVARHNDRPQTLDYIDLIFEEFVELHGDRAFGDDRALRTGFARLGDHRVMLIGHQKGHNLKARQQCFYGCAHPEGYRKAMNKMRLAAKFRRPIICLIDTPGAYPGIGAEERGQAQLIANNLLEMSRLPTPVICIVIGEGGSGGALGIGIGDRVSMLEHAYYSVISPEGCAGILWKIADEQTKPMAAEALRMTAKDLARFGIIDDIIPEPLGGAHRDHREMATTLKAYLLRYLREVKQVPFEELLEGRYQKFRRMGIFEDGISAERNGEARQAE